MIEHRPYAALGGNDLDWLKARLHVAVAGLGRPEHRPIGPLQAWNDDEIAPGCGFPMHRHQDVVILTYVRSGAVTHEDGLGNRSIVQAGDVQAMHAGSGIRHAEFNAGAMPAALYQIWLRPRSSGGAPSWGTRRFSREDRAGMFVVLASGYEVDTVAGALPIDADARVLGVSLCRGDMLEHVLAPGRQAYLVSTTGHATINGLELAARDGAAISNEARLTIIALDDTEMVLAELA